ncbi:MAG TPA: CARDB domain-containing protein, partial [Vicinamibacteria bacterium]|nr:CARDB domain-containing protein [Vicinamibacteria bacterium]
VAGSYYLVARVDSDGVVPETNEGTNTRTAVVAVGADLSVSALTGPASGGAGLTVVVNDTTKNLGAGAAATSLTQFFLSTNTVFDGTDLLLGSRVAPALAAGGTSTMATSLVIPGGTASGNYYVVARADGEGVVPETNEANNTRALNVAVGPDLAVTALSAPAKAGPGATIEVTESTKNQGGGAAGPTATQFFLSVNGSLEASDVLLGSRAIPALEPGATSGAPTSLTLPPNTPAGAYYILARADGEGMVPETNETNNTTRRALVAVGADLAVVTLTAPASAGVGATITVGDTTTNQGGGSAGPTVTRFYLSRNTTWDASDVSLGSRGVPSLAPDASSVGSTPLLIPADTVGGSYYMLARADDASAVAETNEANNTRSVAVLVGPDLVVATLAGPATAAAGGTIAVGDTTRNQGASGSPATRTAFYLSANAAFDAADVFLGSRDVPELAAGAASSVSTALTLPADTPSGTYYVLARADDAASVAETSETNNTRAAATAVGPDLVVALLSVPATAKAGSSISVNDTTKNSGGGTAGVSQTRFYLSINGVLDDTDLLLGSRTVPSLAPGATSATLTSLVLPSGIAPRLYYVLAKADGDEGLDEVNEANNLRVASVTVTAP